MFLFYMYFNHILDISKLEKGRKLRLDTIPTVVQEHHGYCGILYQLQTKLKQNWFGLGAYFAT